MITPVGLVGRIPNPVSTRRPVREAEVFFKFAGVRFTIVGITVRFVSAITVVPEMICSPYDGASFAHGWEEGSKIPHLWERYPSIFKRSCSSINPSKIRNSAT